MLQTFYRLRCLTGYSSDVCHLRSDGRRVGRRKGFHGNVSVEHSAFSNEYAANVSHLPYHG